MKHVLESKTFWVGFAAALLPAVEGLVGVLEYVGVGWETLFSVLGVVMIALRWVTSAPVGLAPEEE